MANLRKAFVKVLLVIHAVDNLTTGRVIEIATELGGMGGHRIGDREARHEAGFRYSRIARFCDKLASRMHQIRPDEKDGRRALDMNEMVPRISLRRPDGGKRDNADEA